MFFQTQSHCDDEHFENFQKQNKLTKSLDNNTKIMTRKLTIILLIALYISPVYSQFKKLENKNHIVNQVLSEIIIDSDFKNAGFAFHAIDATTGEIISSHNPDMELKPASTQKLVTTATILELYGADYKFKTTLEYTGHIDTINHILHGNIIINGGGDPTLGSKYFDKTKNKQFVSTWINAIKKLKIDSIDGAVIADASIYTYEAIPQTWSWNNMGNYYGAGACGLSIYDNYYTLYFNSSNTVGDTVEIAKTIPEIPNLDFENAVIADSISYDNAYIYGAPYAYTRILKGEIPLNKTNFPVKGSMPDPAYMAALELERALNKSGIQLSNNASSVRLLKLKNKQLSNKRVEIVSIYSPELSEIIAETNIHSVNLFAEHCLNHSGLKLTGNPDIDNSSEAIEDFWTEKGMDTQGFSLADGSGLSQYNTISPNQMVFLLNYMKLKSQNFDYFYNSMAIAGETGTVSKMFKNTVAAGNLRVKSGTITRAKAYAGYVKSVSGREIIFSMVVNNFSCSSREARAKLERLMIALAELEK